MSCTRTSPVFIKTGRQEGEMILQGLDLEQKRLLIAEIGNNHEGDAKVAMEMVEAAAEAGADAVKVQVINPERLVNIAHKERLAQLKRFQLSASVFHDMAGLARSKGILFIATPFDDQSLEGVLDCVSAVKIASGDLTYVQLLAAAARTGKPILLSTGMGTLSEIEAAIEAIEGHLPEGRELADSLAILHSVTSYPTPAAEANLRAIETLRDAFELTVGYSDHTLGIDAAMVAASLGARIIEKHFTLDKGRTTFRDHALSADPAEMRRLSAFLRSLDAMLGDGEKQPMPCEWDSLVSARRSVVAARDLAAGVRLTVHDLDFVRPNDGLAPTDAWMLIGHRLGIPRKRHEPVLESHIAE